MATKLDVKLNTVEAVKAAFHAWISVENKKQIDPNILISSLDGASEQLQKRKISLSPLWEITKPSVFDDVYKKARENKLFRIMDKKTYLAFMKDGQVFLKFLKSKPVFQQINVDKDAPTSDEKLPAQLTIKDAVIKVLSDEIRPLTAEEIYDEIIKQGLYAFGAQNPVNVVRNIIESACGNSGYSEKYRVKVPCFHFARNDEGKRVYSLLTTGTVETSKTRDFDIEKTSTLSKHSFNIWDYKIEKNFQKWLECKNYAKRTADSYRRATVQIFRDYAALAQKAVMDSSNELEAVHKYISILNKDSSFVYANSRRHNQFTAALAALERFFSSDTQTTDNCNGELAAPKSEMINASSSLGDIVDLSEGKDGLREILEVHFQTLYGYSNINILWNAAQDSLSLFLNDNAINNADDLWSLIQCAFSGEYVMSNPHIWETRPDYPQSYVGVIINLARQTGGTVTREQIDEYFARIKQGTPINATIIRQGLLMFYENKHFILSEAVNVTSERCAVITKALDRLFERERVSYIVLRDITKEWFSSLPVIKGDIKWTALLLQEVLRLHPVIGYRVIFPGLDGQALDTLGVAIVPSNSDTNVFADVVHHYCYEREILGNKMATEDLRAILREAGMLEGNQLIYNLHRALRDYRFAFTDENKMVKILER